MKTYNITYLTTNYSDNICHVRRSEIVQKVDVFRCNSVQEAIEKFYKFHGDMNFKIQIIQEERV